MLYATRLYLYTRKQIKKTSQANFKADIIQLKFGKEFVIYA